MTEPEKASKKQHSDMAQDFLSGGGELGAYIRAYPWETTSLGKPSSWPQSLKIAVRIMLTSRQPIWIGWGQELVYLYNDPYKSIIGGRHPWALGRPTREVWNEIWNDIEPLLNTALSGDSGTYVESQLLIMERNEYPEETYYTFSYSPIPNDDGSVGGIFCANSDDTRRVIGERQLALLRNVATEASQARSLAEACERGAAALESSQHDLPFSLIYILDADGAVLRLAGVSGISAGGALAPEFIHHDASSPWPAADALRTQSIQLVPDLSLIFDGPIPSGPWPRPPAQAALIPIPPASEAGRGGILIAGLNPFRLFDDEYKDFLGLLGGQIATAIANAQAYEDERRRAEALAELDRAKTTFFSNISHEFRTPLTLMLGPIEDILNDQANEVVPVHRGRLEAAHRNSLRLLKLVNSLLDFARIEAGRANARFEPVDLASYTGELASNFESATEKAGVNLRIACVDLGQPVYVDLAMWEKIVLNLVSNAFKFTFEGEISVTTLVSEDGRHAELVVRDTGVGIPEAELPKLFERFHRIEGQRSRSFEGSGIGLALVQELVKLHGGEIRVESRLDKGTSIIISLPFGKAHLAERDIKPESGSSAAFRQVDAFVEEALRWLSNDELASAVLDDHAENALALAADDARGKPYILVADDNADMRNYLRRLLVAWEVETVPNGEAALQSIRARRPDLLLSDVMMPILDGRGLLREIRSDRDLQDIPVIMLSARAGEEARVEGVVAGADDYLTKPFSARELVARVQTVLEIARLRQEAMRDLRESEERFRNMAEHAPVIMWVSDHAGSITYLNRLWLEFTGQSEEESLGFGGWGAVHPDDYTRLHEEFFEANAMHKPFRAEFRLRDRDGSYQWVMSAAGPRFGDADEFLGFIGSVVNIQHRKEAERVLKEANEILERRVAAAIAERAETERQLRQAQKMEAIGKLTGGVAHDFNNVLQVISGNLQLLARDMTGTGNARAERRLLTAISAVSRGSKIASQLLAFGRRQPLAPKVLNVGRLIRNIDDMLRRALGEGIEIETIISGGLWNTLVDTAQVENALLNLAINARDAMAGQGKLTIEAGNAFLDGDYATNHAEVQPGQYVMIAVTDTGCGIPQSIIDNVFEPFFTTKPEGQGTGLGLSMVYGFVKQSNGHVKIYSEVGHGTTIRIYLPRSKAGEDIETEVKLGAAAGGSGTILVVEDDEEVRETAVDMLTDLGYRVLQAKDGDSALVIIESGAPIDLIFTDVVMPGTLRGPELARRAQERLPGIVVLFTSGYTENAIVHGGRLDEGVELLSKPYTREAVAKKIRSLLQGQARSAPPGRLGRMLLVEGPELLPTAAELFTNLGYAVTQAVDAVRAIDLLQEAVFDVAVLDFALVGEQGQALAARAAQRNQGVLIVLASNRKLPAEKLADYSVWHVTRLIKPYTSQSIAAALNLS